MKSTNEIRTKWVAITPYIYTAVLLLSIVFGFIAGVLINRSGGFGTAGDPIAVISWFILFPAYIIADGILNSNFFWCSLRAAILPLAEGIVIWLVTGWQDPFAVSLGVAFIYLLGSLAVVGITRAVQKSRKA
jgi:hypothetical protein